MKRNFRTIAAAGAAAALLACSPAALAANSQPSPQIAVQLDGKTLSFSDALPQVKDNRTFLPFRAVFEALGAEVSYSDNSVTAKRDGRTVTMTTGSLQASITEDGNSQTLSMDVAPYVDNTTWRTYVPLRFASEAFDCAVGWDSDTNTAIIIDLAPMLEKAMEGKQYTYLEKYMEYAQQFNEGIWDSEAEGKGSMTIIDTDKSVTIPMTVSASGTTSGSTKMDVKMKMSMDFTDLVGLAQGDPAEAAQLAMLNAMFKDGLDAQLRGDLAQNMMYFTLTSKALEEAGLPANTWYKMDFAKLLQTTIESEDGPTAIFSTNVGMSLTDAEIADPLDLLKAIIEIDGLDSVSDYAKIKEAVEYVAGLLSDQSFVKDGDNRVLTVKPEGDIPEESAKFVLTLTMKDDKVVAYAFDMTAKVDGEDPESMSFKIAVDADNKVSGEMKMAISSAMDAQFTITGQSRKGDKAPATEPPTGAAVVSIEDLLGGAPKTAVSVRP